jgi:pyrimidine operon attenuation protein/uracil phosphoribosyltransferase
MSKLTLLDHAALSDELTQLTDDLCRELGDDFALVGIYTGGAHLAARLAAQLAARTGTPVSLGTMDITLYRDDLYTGLEKPVLGETRIPFDITDQGIVLVDDVLFTGRTVRAALNQLMDYGRPRWVKLLVLVDRGHRELPISPDFVGLTVETQKMDRITVSLTEAGSGEDQVSLEHAP